MRTSKIEWTDVTLNPWPGCQKVSAGCQNCYAERMAYRWKMRRVPGYQDIVDANGWTGRIGDRFARICNQMKRVRPGAKVFIESMGDPFFEPITFRMLHSLCCFIENRWSDRIFQILTKRPARALDFFDWRQRFTGGPRVPANVWMGVTIENSQTMERARPLRQIGAPVTFVSCEPWLGPLDKIAMHAIIGEIDWLICGSETGPGYRDRHLSQISDFAWFRQACADVGTAFFCKSLQQGSTILRDPELIEAQLWARAIIDRGDRDILGQVSTKSSHSIREFPAK